MKEKTAKALYALLKELYKSPAAKDFVDTYEREEHERRHQSQAVPVKWSIERDNAYQALTEAIFKRKPLAKIQAAAETFVDICHREEIERKPKPDRAWSPEKASAYNWLLTDFIRHKHYDEIVADARRLAAVCEREERVKPEVSDVYRDIFGNRYVVVTEEFLDGKHPRVGLIRVGTKGEAIFSEFLTPTLEDFMNPTFKKE